MTNDTTTLNGALTELGETLAENLTMKGINANAEDGLTTLANKIKDIRFDLSAAALTLTASTEEVLLNDSVELSARLVNQNNAPICGAVVLFKTDLLADPVIGHAVTNDDGVATFEYVVDAYGVYDFYAEFLGIEQCTSQQATVTCDYNLVLSADKDILSYNDSDSCTITCILDSETGLVENEEINYSIMHNETELAAGTLTTDENGEITLEYAATGVGNVDVIFSLRSLLQKTYEVQDCRYWNSNEVSVTGSNKHTLYDPNLSVTLPTNAEISFDVINEYISGNKDYRWWLLSKSLFNGMSYPNDALFFDKKLSYILYNQQVNGSTKYSSSKQFSASKYANIKYVKNGTSVKVYVDDVFMFEDTVSWIDNYTDYTISMMKWSGDELIKMKNVKIKNL